MTGATGDLTPDATDSAFDPGERREAADPVHHADVTLSQGRRAPAQRGEIGDPGDLPIGGPTNMATRDEGYGSQHGLSPDDPAYRMETHPEPQPPAGALRPAHDADQTRLGGDEAIEGEPRF